MTPYRLNQASFPVRLRRRLSRPGLTTACRGAQRRGWEERSRPEPRAAPPSARAWRGRRAPDLPWSEHRGTLGSGGRNRRRVWFVRVQPRRHALCRHRSRDLARRPPLCRLAGCFEVVRRPLPRRVIATIVWFVSVLVLLYHCQCRAKPLVLHDLARFHGLDLVKLPERQRYSLKPKFDSGFGKTVLRQ